MRSQYEAHGNLGQLDNNNNNKNTENNDPPQLPSSTSSSYRSSSSKPDKPSKDKKSKEKSSSKDKSSKSTSSRSKLPSSSSPYSPPPSSATSYGPSATSYGSSNNDDFEREKAARNENILRNKEREKGNSIEVKKEKLKSWCALNDLPSHVYSKFEELEILSLKQLAVLTEKDIEDVVLCLELNIGKKSSFLVALNELKLKLNPPPQPMFGNYGIKNIIFNSSYLPPCSSSF
jgi:hypothetical protein